MTNKKPAKSHGTRLIRTDGKINLQRIGINRKKFSDIYHFLLRIKWKHVLLILFGLFFVVNILFAILYYIGGSHIRTAKSFWDLFFFSVQTMTTIGYGAMYPVGLYANILAYFESILALLTFAIVTGITFAKFAVPTAKVFFSKKAVLRIFDGKPTLMFRIANERLNQILEAKVYVTLVAIETTKEGEKMRRFYELELVRHKSPIFALSWSVIHIIDKKSPLYKLNYKAMVEKDVQLIVIFTGTDEIFNQKVHARHSYILDEIIFNHRLKDTFVKNTDGTPLVNFNYFHDTEPITSKVRVSLSKPVGSA